MTPEYALTEMLRSADLPAFSHIEPLGGGSINQAFRVWLTNDECVFFKFHGHPPDAFFESEGAGLRALSATGTVRIPEVIAHSENGLLLEWLSGVPGGDFDRQFGEQLAAMHATPASSFGFDRNNYCGLTPQSNPQMQDGYRFFGEARLRFQGKLALERGHLKAQDMVQLEILIDRLPELVPEQPPSLIHGDLWSGNVHCGPEGEPVLVDPAAHCGWAEAELAMTTLFGRQSSAFYEAYQYWRGIDNSWESRAAIYNLYHLLNHLNLFGGGYRSSVLSCLKRYV